MKNKTGLILEGGGMRGAFTAGVLDAFIENNIEFDNCIGVSAGACHACSYLSKQHKRAFNTNVDYLKDKRYCSLYSLIKTGDLFGAEFIYDEIPNKLNKFDYETFDKRKTKFEVVVTNCKSGKPEYVEIKDIKKDIIYVRASSSLPFVSRMVKINNKEFLDGGLTDSVPLTYYLKNKIDKVVVVLTRPYGYRKNKSKYTRLIKKVYKKYPNLQKALGERYIKYNETMDKIDSLEKEGKIYVIRPSKKLDIGRIEKSREKLDAAYKEGYNIAKDNLKHLTDFLK